MAGQYFRNPNQGRVSQAPQGYHPPYQQEYQRTPYQHQEYVEEEYYGDFDPGYSQQYDEYAPNFDQGYELSPVEVRLAKANCYRMLLESQLFADGDRVSQEVEEEVRDFIKSKLGNLMGVTHDPRSNKAVETFSAEEIDVLKRLAAKMLNSSDSGSKKEESQAPTAQPPSSPAPAPRRPTPAPSRPPPPPAAPVRQQRPPPPPQQRPPPRPVARPTSALPPRSGALRASGPVFGGRSQGNKMGTVMSPDGKEVSVNLATQVVSSQFKPVPMASVQAWNARALQQSSMLLDNLDAMSVKAEEGQHRDY